MTHKGTVALETERLILRRLTPEDASPMFRNWANDPEVTKYLTWQPHGSVDVTRNVISDWIRAYEKPDYYSWAIELKSLGEPIGSIAVVQENDAIRMVSIGYCIGKAWWRKGFASEALAELVRFFFEEVGANRIEARHDPRNPNSGKVMMKAGLQYEGIHRQSGKNNQNGFCDIAHYGILAKDYRKERKQPMCNKSTFSSRAFIYRNARPLDFARFQFHFECGAKEAVLNALAAFQNEDGGFGHALEPDAWNPNSTPIQTWAATEILREIDFTDSGHPILQGILRYLAGGKDFDGKFWFNTVRSNNDYPHAQWWHTESDSACHNDYNPTACLAGFIIRFAEENSDLHRLGCRLAKEAYDAYFAQDLLGDMNTAGCFIRLMEYCEEAGTDAINIKALRERVKAQVKHSITSDTSLWETGYICKPSQFFTSRDSIFYADNKDIADYECDFIIRTQQSDGAWLIPWSWNEYPEEWAVSKNWWKTNGAILNLLYLKGMGRL
jgi:RimJ/RimL family protein N-acetyltransferase